MARPRRSLAFEAVLMVLLVAPGCEKVLDIRPGTLGNPSGAGGQACGGPPVVAPFSPTVQTFDFAPSPRGVAWLGSLATGNAARFATFGSSQIATWSKAADQSIWRTRITQQAVRVVGAATGDVDGDGALDLVVVREGGGFSVMTPEPDGTLTEVITGSVLAEATALLVVDIDEDGKADWIIGEAADRLAVFRSGGGAAGSIEESVALEHRPELLAAGQLAAPGVDVVAVAPGQQSAVLSVVSGVGDGALQVTSASPQAVATAVTGIAVGALVGDAAEDVALSHAAGVAILAGDGSGQLADWASRTTALAGFAAKDVAVGMLDGDASLDLVACGEEGVQIALGSTGLTVARAVSSESWGHCLVAGFDDLTGEEIVATSASRQLVMTASPSDVNASSFVVELIGPGGDGDAALVDSESLRWFLINKRGRLSVFEPVSDQTELAFTSYAVDGLARDLALYSPPNKPKELYTAKVGAALRLQETSADHFTSVAEISSEATISALAIARAQLGGDTQDLALGLASGELRVRLRGANASLAPATSIATGVPISELVARRVTHPALDDLIAVGGGQLALARATAQSDAPYVVTAALDLGGTLASPAVGDLDNDGHADIVVLDTTSSKAHPLLGDGTGRLNVAPPIQLAPSARSIALADLDYDGSLDLVVAFAGDPSVVRVYVGEGTQLAQQPGEFTVAGEPLRVFARDITGNCRDDVLVATESAWLLLRNGLPP